MSIRTALLLGLLLSVPWSQGTTALVGSDGLHIVGVHPGGARDWEHVFLENRGDRPVDLVGCSLTDGEGTWTIPTEMSLAPGERVGVGINSSAFHLLWRRPVDIVAERAGALCLADKGDSLTLLDPDGRTVDQLVYGACEETPDGWEGPPVVTPSSMPWGRMLCRSGSVDSDTASDWSAWTEPRCGWMDATPSHDATGVNASCFICPESGWSALSSALLRATRTLDIAVYDITSLDLAALVADRARRGVEVRLLVEGSPVGKDDGQRAWRESLLAALEGKGVEVWTTAPTVKGVRHAPYRFHHEKYCVADGRLALVTTENLCASSFPTRTAMGRATRGWGAVVESPDLARDLVDVFEHDLRLSAARFDPSGEEPARLPSPLETSPPPHPSRAARAGLLVGPEGWGPDLRWLLAPILAAEGSVLLQLAYLDVRWGSDVSPMVEALLEAAGRGVEVRVVLDPGVDGEGFDALRELQLLSHVRGVRGLRGVLAAGIEGVDRVHTKGMVVDGRVAVLGSLNWAWSAVARNREVVVLVEGEEAVSPLVEAFEADWETSAGHEPPSVPLALAFEAAARWGGPGYPRGDLEPLGQLAGGPDGGREEGGASRGGPDAAGIARTVLVVGLFIAAWALDRRFCYTARALAWTRGRTRRVRRRVEASSPPPPRGEGAPCAPRTTCPGSDPGKGPPPAAPSPGPPRRREPRVVHLEEAR
jgi:phosphatidylserine/phosphatidylglycerophosphate/cardiolipin synthase-like enzyme